MSINITLSPQLNSLVSPDIPASLFFKWETDGTATRYVLSLWDQKDEQPGKVIHTYESDSRSETLSIEEFGYEFVLGTTYYWNIKLYNEKNELIYDSLKAQFRYISCPKIEMPDFSAMASPAAFTKQAGPFGLVAPGEELDLIIKEQFTDTIKKELYFKTLKDNLTKFATGFYSYKTELYNQIDQLFLGDVVPSRDDFTLLQKILRKMGEIQGITYHSNGTETRPSGITRKIDGRIIGDPGSGHTPGWVAANTPYLDVIGKVEDSLGISDLFHISQYLEMLTNIPPKSISSVSIDYPGRGMYQLDTFLVTYFGEKRDFQDISLSANPTIDTLVSFYVGSSPSPDAWVYLINLEYGNRRDTELYFTRSEMGSGRWFHWDYADLAYYNGIGVSGQVIDYYGNLSSSYGDWLGYDASRPIPRGVSHYEVEMATTGANPIDWTYIGGYFQIYSGDFPGYRNYLRFDYGAAWYRGRVVDKSGMVSDWRYDGPFIYDPLEPPGPVTGLNYTNVSQKSWTFNWDATPTADKYIIKIPSGEERDTWSTNWVAPSVSDSTTYTCSIRACNRKGCGPWSTKSVTTPGYPPIPDPPPDYPIKYAEFDSNHCHAYNLSTGRWRPDEGYNHTRAYFGHGQSGHWCTFFYFDYNHMRSFLRGKNIVGGGFRIRRDWGGVANPNEPRDIAVCLHNHTRDYGHYVNDKYGGAGDGRYVKAGETGTWDLPAWYITDIVSGKAKGMGISDPWGGDFTFFNNFAQIYVYYKDK